jgi:N-acetyl-gamma-glutamyl-phosphate reductase
MRRSGARPPTLVHPDVELVGGVGGFRGRASPLRTRPSRGDRSQVREAVDRRGRGRVDVVLLAATPGECAQAPKLVAAGVHIVDLSGDFRLKSAASYDATTEARSLRRRCSEPSFGRPSKTARPFDRPSGWRPGCFRPPSSSVFAARPRGPPRRGGRDRRDHRFEGSGVVPSAGRTTRCAREPAHVQPLAPARARIETLAAARPFALFSFRVSAAGAWHLRPFVRVAESATRAAANALHRAFAGEPFAACRQRLPEVAAVPAELRRGGFRARPPLGGTRVLSVFSVTDNPSRGRRLAIK